MSGPVVVGVDDFEGSGRIVSAAAHEARIRKAPLWLVHAYQWIPPVAYGVPPSILTEEALRDSAKAQVEKAAEGVRADHPGLLVEGVAAAGAPAQVLTDTANLASLVVVGGRGRGGFTGQLLGSVALRVISHAHCPVMVVRGDPAPATHRIMVGVDVGEPATGPEVLDFAFDEAVSSGAHIYAIHGWEEPSYLYPTLSVEELRKETGIYADQRHRLLDDVLNPWAAKHPGTVVSRQAFQGSPAKVLVESTRLADMLVIGGKTRADSRGMRIGPLAHTVLHHAHCPVVVVPEH